MRITIHVSEPAARALHQTTPALEVSDEVLRVAEQLNVALEPMHASIEDPSLMRQFTVEVGDHARADEVVQAFLRCEAVEGAYVKPAEGPPD